MDAQHWRLGDCFFCKSPTADYFCEVCETDFFKHKPRCPVCASINQSGLICGDCLQKPPAFDNTFVITDYAYPVDRYIQSLKYHDRPEFILHCAQLLANRLKQQVFHLPDTLVPVPLHRSRQRQRGYNQSQILAKQLSRLLGVTMHDKDIVRTRKTVPQTDLALERRKKNVKNAFQMIGKPNVEHIAIIDDVITSGSTVDEIARLYKRSGCKEIEVWAIAKTVDE